MVTSVVESKEIVKTVVVNFILGSNTKLPQAELSNIKPKSEKIYVKAYK